MTKTKSSSLTMKRIVISLLLFGVTPIISAGIKVFLNNDTIAMMFALNFVAWILIIYDWELLGLHYNRVKRNLGESLIYILIGIVLISFWLYFGYFFLQAKALPVSHYDAGNSVFALPGILFGYSFSYALIINISFKCLTDHIPIHNRELLVILVSGFLFGTILTLAFTNFELISLVTSLLYNIVLVSILSYLYNQSTSILPGAVAMTIVYLLFQIIFLI